MAIQIAETHMDIQLAETHMNMQLVEMYMNMQLAKKGTPQDTFLEMGNMFHLEEIIAAEGFAIRGVEIDKNPNRRSSRNSTRGGYLPPLLPRKF
jgi:hypothetical protein